MSRENLETKTQNYTNQSKSKDEIAEYLRKFMLEQEPYNKSSTLYKFARLFDHLHGIPSEIEIHVEVLLERLIDIINSVPEEAIDTFINEGPIIALQNSPEVSDKIKDWVSNLYILSYQYLFDHNHNLKKFFIQALNSNPRYSLNQFYNNPNLDSNSNIISKPLEAVNGTIVDSFALLLNQHFTKSLRQKSDIDAFKLGIVVTQVQQFCKQRTQSQNKQEYLQALNYSKAYYTTLLLFTSNLEDAESYISDEITKILMTIKDYDPSDEDLINAQKDILALIKAKEELSLLKKRMIIRLGDGKDIIVTKNEVNYAIEKTKEIINTLLVVDKADPEHGRINNNSQQTKTDNTSHSLLSIAINIYNKFILPIIEKLKKSDSQEVHQNESLKAENKAQPTPTNYKKFAVCRKFSEDNLKNIKNDLDNCVRTIIDPISMRR